jgi:hypothetical protein
MGAIPFFGSKGWVEFWGPGLGFLEDLRSSAARAALDLKTTT